VADFALEIVAEWDFEEFVEIAAEVEYLEHLQFHFAIVGRFEEQLELVLMIVEAAAVAEEVEIVAEYEQHFEFLQHFVVFAIEGFLVEAMFDEQLRHCQ
jgi:hypothetical protein